MRYCTHAIPDETVALNRREDCTKYSDCLLYAARQDWPSFSCLFCDLYKKDPEHHKNVFFTSDHAMVYPKPCDIPSWHSEAGRRRDAYIKGLRRGK